MNYTFKTLLTPICLIFILGIQIFNYVRNQEKLYQDFKDAVEEKWGSFRFSTKKVYVDYDEDLNARSSINFDKGAVEVEVIVEDEPNKSSTEKKKAGEKLLQEKIARDHGYTVIRHIHQLFVKKI